MINMGVYAPNTVNNCPSNVFLFRSKSLKTEPGSLNTGCNCWCVPECVWCAVLTWCRTHWAWQRAWQECEGIWHSWHSWQLRDSQGGSRPLHLHSAISPLTDRSSGCCVSWGCHQFEYWAGFMWAGAEIILTGALQKTQTAAVNWSRSRICAPGPGARTDSGANIDSLHNVMLMLLCDQQRGSVKQYSDWCLVIMK